MSVKTSDYMMSDEFITQNYCAQCRLWSVAMGQVASDQKERADCTDCYGGLRKRMEHVDILQRYRI